MAYNFIFIFDPTGQTMVLKTKDYKTNLWSSAERNNMLNIHLIGYSIVKFKIRLNTNLVLFSFLLIMIIPI